MNHQTEVKNLRVKSRAERLLRESAQFETIPVRKNGLGTWLLQLDSLVRNLAVVGGLVLVVIAVRNSSLPEAQSVFSALQEGTTMQWDESVGKLSFVNRLLPEEIQEVWNETPDVVSVYAPMNGSVVHAWSQEEPYLLIQGNLPDVHVSADGEVMSIAHGMEEERIVRIRHGDDTETVYGNLDACIVEVGDQVLTGDLLGQVRQDQPLAFEILVEGRSVDPTHRLISALE